MARRKSHVTKKRSKKQSGGRAVARRPRSVRRSSSAKPLPKYPVLPPIASSAPNRLPPLPPQRRGSMIVHPGFEDRAQFRYPQPQKKPEEKSFFRKLSDFVTGKSTKPAPKIWYPPTLRY